MTHSIGILAYGSLIGDPGMELESHIAARIDCTTPFAVEFARSSKSRKGGPTLVPYESGGPVQAQILTIDLPLEEVINRLYRRELHKVGSDIVYSPPAKTTPNTVLVKKLLDFEGVDTVLYTSIGANISELSAEKLARLAVGSAKEITDGRDGISYLINAITAGIITPLTPEYERLILNTTGASNLTGALSIVRSAQKT
ncbi:hypothetical protein [Rhizobium leguminosarum]|uniref:hypothetical protein n=1 Tax=Rhizobium leguminosarum TaxID=384 RepID=UPI00103BF1E3|nr:hypothetical protein [Rhizobium leguminosarum]NKK29596.1 hypothetical protein [Rhizobium leguminosarum bv. viciae]TBZ54223.1 hypothetical protein E0H42_14375 [Rhizobium leguminosarum bv. viciae]